MGRPRMDDQRGREIVDAFLGLVAEKGLAETTLDDVAAAVDLRRGTVRHFVGNRRDLVVTAAERLIDRYEETFRAAVLDPPDAGATDRMLDFLFTEEDVLATEEKAFDALMQPSSDDDRVRGVLASAYERYIAVIDECLALDTDAPADARRGVAVSILCLAEMANQLLYLGFPATDRASAGETARSVAGRLATVDVT
ncbi:MAG: TetR/AcrR family transcriptional regulator [Acidimicrobiales bacterium]